MDGDGLNWCDAEMPLDFAKAVKLELFDLIQGVWILPVVLDDVDVIGDSQETGEGGGFGVPQWRRYDTWRSLNMDSEMLRLEKTYRIEVGYSSFASQEAPYRRQSSGSSVGAHRSKFLL